VDIFRALRAIYEAIRVFLRHLWRLARQLFHEVTGALFAVFAFGGALAAVREWRQHAAVWAIVLAIGFAAMMASFATTSFIRANRVR